MWVTYNGVVYDVTSFIEHHPGGKGLILTAGGYDLGHFFENYTACSPLFHPIPIYLYIHKPTFGLRVPPERHNYLYCRYCRATIH